MTELITIAVFFCLGDLMDTAASERAQLCKALDDERAQLVSRNEENFGFASSTDGAPDRKNRTASRESRCT